MQKTSYTILFMFISSLQNQVYFSVVHSCIQKHRSQFLTFVRLHLTNYGAHARSAILLFVFRCSDHVTSVDSADSYRMYCIKATMSEHRAVSCIYVAANMLQPSEWSFRLAGGQTYVRICEMNPYIAWVM